MNFYKKCAKVLNVDYTCEDFIYPYRTRWNNRLAGNGRFPGYGIIRKFGDKIQVSFRHPNRHHKIYDSEEEVLNFLSTLEKEVDD